MKNLTILGGSSPFTIALIDAIKGQIAKQIKLNMVLYGRDEDKLKLISSYATYHLAPLGWTCSYTTDVVNAIECSDIILNQIRFGGLDGRLLGEKIACKYQLPADETLGPAAFYTLLNITPDIINLANLISKHCPRSLFINLTNPLSLTTALFYHYGVKNIVGLCELPMLTIRKIAHTLYIDEHDLEYKYTGLNHRGFIYDLKYNQVPMLGSLTHSLSNSESINGISATDIKELSGVPLKYFKLFTCPSQDQKGRAEYLMELRYEIFTELEKSIAESPASLQKRYMAWYPDAVVPFLKAWFGNKPQRLVVNQMLKDGIVNEYAVDIFDEQIRQIEINSEPPDIIKNWMAVFKKHEYSSLNAALEPSLQNIRNALASDPLIPQSMAVEISEEIYSQLTRSYIQ